MLSLSVARRDLALLIAIAAMWGASYIFIRIAVPVLGPWVLLFARMGIACLAIAAFIVIARQRVQLFTRWRSHLFCGFMGSVLGQVLLAYAAYRLGASLLAITGAAAPLWAALIAKLAFNAKLGPRRALGLALGPMGVAFVVGFAPLQWDALTIAAVAAAITTPLCYAISTTYTSRRMHHVDSLELSLAPQFFAGLLLAVPAALTLPTQIPSMGVLLAVAVLAVFSTALAGRLYVGLLKRTDATVSLSIMFLVPMFSLLWGWLFLGETLNWRQACGFAVIVVALLLVVGKRKVEASEMSESP